MNIKLLDQKLGVLISEACKIRRQLRDYKRSERMIDLTEEQTTIFKSEIDSDSIAQAWNAAKDEFNA